MKNKLNLDLDFLGNKHIFIQTQKTQSNCKLQILTNVQFS